MEPTRRYCKDQVSMGKVPMGSAKHLALILIAMVCISLSIVGCESPSNKVTMPVGITVKESVIADVLGDGNRSASADELERVWSYFSQHSTGWFVGVLPREESERSEISRELVFVAFEGFQLWGPYDNETELRNAWKAQLANTRNLGVYVIEKDRYYTITRLYRVEGGSVYDSALKEIAITIYGLKVSLGEEFVLHEGQSAVIEEEDLVVKVVTFFNSPCPEWMECDWSGVGIRFHYWHGGDAERGVNVIQALGYQTTVLDTDHETFARLTITKI